jgi:hypothetical protein
MQAQYAHNVCGIEVFGVVFEPGYGNINATVANTMFAGSTDLAAFLTNKKVTGKALIGKIQALVRYVAFHSVFVANLTHHAVKAETPARQAEQKDKG